MEDIATPAKKRRVLIGVPLHNGTCDAYRRAYADIEKNGLEGWDHTWMEVGGCGITVARNVIAARAIHEGFDALLFVASDIGFRRVGHVERILSHLDRPDVQIVSGCYLFKRFPLQLVMAQDTARPIDDNGLVQVNRVGTDFVAIWVDSLRSIIDKWSWVSPRVHTALVPLEYPSHISNDFSYRGQQWNIFGQAVAAREDGKGWEFLTEDFYWCRLAREAGLPIHVDSRVRLQHWGQACYDAGAVTGLEQALCTPNPEPRGP